MLPLPMLRKACFLLATASALLASACSDTAQFTTRTAAGFAPGGHKVSVLGVYKDGRMNPDVWEQIGPGLAASLGGQCPLGYDSLVSTNPGLSGAIDDYARANGIGDELLGAISPAAAGDVVLVVTVAGHVGAHPPGLDDLGSMTTGSPGQTSNKYRGPGASQTPTSTQNVMRRPRQALADGSAFEMAVSLYSVAKGASLGLVAMKYAGPSVDDAVSRLAERLRADLPGLSCAGWTWGASVDEAKIRRARRALVT